RMLINDVQLSAKTPHCPRMDVVFGPSPQKSNTRNPSSSDKFWLTQSFPSFAKCLKYSSFNSLSSVSAKRLNASSNKKKTIVLGGTAVSLPSPKILLADRRK